jgi:exodeoxyribonuclease III
MRLATYNVNGINGRLPVLLRWLAQSEPDVVCLQELKTSDDRFPQAALEKAGYGAIWHGQKSWYGVAILSRGCQPEETRRGLPGDPNDTHSRYIEASINGMLLGCIYLPNGNPAPGAKFAYKLSWFERLSKYAKALVAYETPVILAGDYNVIPTDLDAYKPERWVKDERYATSEAAINHLNNFLKLFAAPFSTAVNRRRFVVYGNVTDDLRAILDRLGAATYLRPYENLAYWG